MRLAVQVGTIADGTLAGAIRYARDLDVARLTVPFAAGPGFQDKGYLDLAACRELQARVQDAALSFSVMAFWAQEPMVMGLPESEPLFADLCKSMDTMREISADVLSIFATIPPPDDPAETRSRWDTLLTFYRRFIARADETGTRVAPHSGDARPQHIVGPGDRRAALCRHPQPQQRPHLLRRQPLEFGRRGDVRRLAPSAIPRILCPHVQHQGRVRKCRSGSTKERPISPA